VVGWPDRGASDTGAAVQVIAELQQVAREVAGCTACGLARTRHRTVPGEGSPTAQIMFIGEGPGYHEDQQGRPFVGPAGQFLNELLASIGLKREDVFIGNVVKCRPPNNRDPQPDEIAACDGYLRRQIAAIRPRMIVTLGRFSMAKFFPGETISKIHGQARTRDGVIYVPMYHPAAALHQPALRRFIEDDFRKLPELLATLTEPEPELEPTPPEPPTATQLTLF
jgi:uracil-DNA glycosylase family 4